MALILVCDGVFSILLVSYLKGIPSNCTQRKLGTSSPVRCARAAADTTDALPQRPSLSLGPFSCRIQRLLSFNADYGLMITKMPLPASLISATSSLKIPQEFATHRAF